MGWTSFGTNINPVTPIPRIDAPSWFTATFYRYGDVVYTDSKHYQCIDGHTSGTFATDLASGLWLHLTEVTDTIGMVIGINPLPLDAVKIIKNGTVLSRFSDYFFLNVRHDYANARTTGLVGFRQALKTGDVLLMQYDSAYADYIGSALLALEPRISSLETKVGSATNIESRLNTLSSGLISVVSDIGVINNSLSLLDGRMSTTEMHILGMGSFSNSLNTRVLALEKFLGGVGKVTIENNQVTPLEIPELVFDGNVHTSIRLDFEIQRYTGTEFRSSVGTLHFCLKQNGVWMTDRNVTSFDFDGVEFTIATYLDKIGSVSYTSDEVVGASYVGTLKFRKINFEVM